VVEIKPSGRKRGEKRERDQEPIVPFRVRFRIGRFWGGAESPAGAAAPLAPSACVFRFSVALAIDGGPDWAEDGVAGVGAADGGADSAPEALVPAPCVCAGFGLFCFCGEDGSDGGWCCAEPLGPPGVGAFATGVPGNGPPSEPGPRPPPPGGPPGPGPGPGGPCDGPTPRFGRMPGPIPG
jgi:hypothetical protein